MKLSYDEAVAKIKENSNMSKEEIDSSVSAKLDQFAGLVSKEGAAHILANELGIKLIDASAQTSKIKINNLVAGMQNVEVLTKILAIYPAKQFSTGGRTGQVGSMMLGDETGNVRAVLWNEQANKLSLMNKGDILKLQSVYVKENRNSSLELHANVRSQLVMNPPGESVEAKEFKRETPRKKLGELADTDSWVEVLGTVIEVFDLKFFEVCSQCGKRAKPENNSYICAQHGAVTPAYSYLVNIFLDDGSAAIRTVFFRESAQKFLKKSDEELLAFREAPEAFEAVKNESLGSFLKLNARVNKNEMFNRLELVANGVEEAKPEEVQATVPVAPAATPQTAPSEPTPVTETKVETSNIETNNNNPGS